jgi:hypothetical protein
MLKVTIWLGLLGYLVVRYSFPYGMVWQRLGHSKWHNGISKWLQVNINNIIYDLNTYYVCSDTTYVLPVESHFQSFIHGSSPDVIG